MPDDVALLQQLDSKLDALARDVGAIKLEVEEMDRRVRRIERAHPGGRWAKTVERIVIATLTMMLGYQTVRPIPAAPASAPIEAER